DFARDGIETRFHQPGVEGRKDGEIDEREIESAAMIDGDGLFQTIRIITLPLAAPVVATSRLFAFLLAWDEFFYALL
ncbi:hypothetical protein ACC754_44940, partial [Rhizobium johnstonii]